MTKGFPSKCELDQSKQLHISLPYSTQDKNDLHIWQEDINIHGMHIYSLMLQMHRHSFYSALFRLYNINQKQVFNYSYKIWKYWDTFFFYTWNALRFYFIRFPPLNVLVTNSNAIGMRDLLIIKELFRLNDYCLLVGLKINRLSMQTIFMLNMLLLV